MGRKYTRRNKSRMKGGNDKKRKAETPETSHRATKRGNPNRQQREKRRLEKLKELATPRTKHNKEHVPSSNKIYIATEFIQFPFSDERQFTEYPGLSENPTNDCFFQSLVALGIRDLTLAKEDATQANSAKMGVPLFTISEYIKDSFDIQDQQRVLVEEADVSTADEESVKKQLNGYLSHKLSVNHTSLFNVKFRVIDKESGLYLNAEHSMIVYRKGDGKIIFFNPQEIDPNKKITPNIYDMFQPNDKTDYQITGFEFFIIKNFVKGMRFPLVNSTCPIVYGPPGAGEEN